MKDCIFCKIVEGEILLTKFTRTSIRMLFLDIAGDVWGHTLVVPKKHCANTLDCDDETLCAVILAAKKIAAHFVENCGFDGVDILNANNEAAQQSVFHLHYHVIPPQKERRYRYLGLSGKA